MRRYMHTHVCIHVCGDGDANDDCDIIVDTNDDNNVDNIDFFQSHHLVDAQAKKVR